MAKRGEPVSKGRKWIVTDWLKPEDGDWERAIQRWQDALTITKVRYAVWVVEQGETEKPHIQGFLHLQKNHSLGMLKKLLQCSKIHAEQVKSDEKAEHYCSKPHEGCDCKHCKKPGERLWGPATVGQKPVYHAKKTESPTDMLTALVAEGATDEQIAEVAPWALLRHKRGIDALRFAHMKSKSKEWRHVEVILLTGDAGTGKTAWAISESGDGYYKPDLSKKELWFDGYQGERTLILDDFCGSSTKFEELLKLLDGHQLQLPIKGGHTYAMWTRVIITSNTEPESWYQRLNGFSPSYESVEEKEWRQKESNAFWRRITLHVSDINEPAKYPECLEKVAAAVRRAQDAAAKPSQGEQSAMEQGDLTGLW